MAKTKIGRLRIKPHAVGRLQESIFLKNSNNERGSESSQFCTLQRSFHHFKFQIPTAWGLTCNLATLWFLIEAWLRPRLLRAAVEFPQPSRDACRYVAQKRRGFSEIEEFSSAFSPPHFPILGSSICFFTRWIKYVLLGFSDFRKMSSCYCYWTTVEFYSWICLS